MGSDWQRRGSPQGRSHKETICDVVGTAVEDELGLLWLWVQLIEDRTGSTVNLWSNRIGLWQRGTRSHPKLCVNCWQWRRLMWSKSSVDYIRTAKGKLWELELFKQGYSQGKGLFYEYWTLYIGNTFFILNCIMSVRHCEWMSVWVLAQFILIIKINYY